MKKDDDKHKSDLFDPPLWMWLFWFALILVTLGSLVLSTGV